MTQQHEQASIQNENIEVTLLLEAIYLKYGYDFRDYSRASIKRRIKNFLSVSKLQNISHLQYKILHDVEYFENLLGHFSIHVTEMFRDPLFFKCLKEDVFPLLSHQTFLKIWNAGCASGEEVYSTAILLKELDLYDNVQIYATDFNEKILKQAKSGLYSLKDMQDNTKNYQLAGGQSSFSKYYDAEYNSVLMAQSLKENIVFADHNLVTDTTFGEMNLIICRNVLIYFNRKLQNRVFQLFQESLCSGGFLCLGPKETLYFADCAQNFSEFNSEFKIYRKK